jgi:hypothetical protein
MRGMGGYCGVSANECSCAHGPQINFVDLTPYLTYAGDIAWGGLMVGEVVLGASALDIARPEPFSVVNSTAQARMTDRNCIVLQKPVWGDGGGGGSEAPARQCFQIL